MANLNHIKEWLLNTKQQGNSSIIKVQSEQAKARILFACAGLLYLSVHTESFSSYQFYFLTSSAIYFLATAISIVQIKRHPVSITRNLLFPLFDIFVVSFGMLIDGGQSSGIFFILFVIIFGNAFRFGNPMMLYTQALALIGLLAMTSYTYFVAAMTIDTTLLLWQISALLVIPLYVLLIGQKAEDAMRGKNEAEETSFLLLDKGPLPVFTFETSSNQPPHIIYANEATNELLNHDQIHLIGEPVETLVLPEDGKEMIRFCQSALTEQNDDGTVQAQSSYIRGRSSSGDILRLMLTAIRLRWGDRWIGVCFLLDITEREALQEQLEAVHKQGYMSTLVAGIVHDFRNILTNMIGYAEVVQMGNINSLEKEQINAIIAAGERGSELITHLLKLSKGNRNRSQQFTRTEGVSLAQPLENIISLARLQLPKNIKLICNIDQQLPDVAINVIEIEQILLNLINNSMQAIHGQGLIKVELGCNSQHRIAQQQPALMIKVSDNGEGIAEKHLDLIFKPFWTSRAKEGGSGLGLSMVQHIIKLHHGTVEVQSEPDKLTCFTICLPPYIEKEGQPPQGKTVPSNVNKPPIAAAESTSSRHILLVDDAPDILKIHKALLTHLNHSSESTNSANEALALFQKDPAKFDLIITDFRMPGMNGLELVEAIRMIDRQIPILMVTAYGEDEQLQQASNFNVLLMNKPITLDKLKEAVFEVLFTAGK